MFRDLYSFERFEQDQFQNLESESKKFYQRLIKFTIIESLLPIISLKTEDSQLKWEKES